MRNENIEIWGKGSLGPAVTVCKGSTSRNQAFKVLTFTDMHLDDYTECRKYTWKLLEQSIQLEHPDLVIFLGDNVTGGFNADRLESFCQGMDALETYWCPVLGNHEGDNPLSVTRADMVKRFSQSKFCLLESDRQILKDGQLVEGNGNYAVHLASRDKRIFFTLFFLDGGGSMSSEEKAKLHLDVPADRTVYEYIRPSQIDWYKEVLKEQPEVPSVVFCHIPLPEFAEGYDQITDHDTRYSFGEKNAQGNTLLSGYRREKVAASLYNGGMYKAMQESESTIAYICGHDHINDFRIEYGGIHLWYNIPSGFSSYNVLSSAKSILVGKTNRLLQGYSVYTFSETGELAVEEVRYEDKYPEEQEGIRKVIRK